MRNQIKLALLASLCLTVYGHHYGQPRLSGHSQAGYYSSDLGAGAVTDQSNASPHDPQPEQPAGHLPNSPSQPQQQPQPQKPLIHQTQTSQPPKMQSGFQPSGASFQRGTEKFTDNVRQGLVQGLEEFLGVHGGPVVSPNTNTKPSSVTYANPSALSYHAPGPFIYGNSPSYASQTRPAYTYGRQQSVQTTYGQVQPQVVSRGTPTSNYQGQRILNQQEPQQVRVSQQSPTHTSWFRQDHGSVTGTSSLGRYAPTEYQTQPQIASGSSPVTTYDDGSRQYQAYSYQ